MPVKFNNFNPGNVLPNSFVVGYESPSPGGERRWTFSQLIDFFATNITSRIQNLLIPTGTVTAYASPNGVIPAGWVLCDGRSTAGYPSLAAIVGSNVPDLRGYFIRGAGTNSDGSASGPYGQRQQDAIQTFTLSNASGGGQLKGLFASTTRTAPFPAYDGTTGMGPGVNFSDNGTGSIARAYNDYANETRPKNIPLWYIIKT